MKSRRSWLVTWNNDSKSDISLLSILHGDMEESQVKFLIQEFYVAHHASAEELIDDQLRFRSTFIAKIETTNNGHTFVHCGHNPWITARIVENIRIKDENLDGIQGLEWDEIR